MPLPTKLPGKTVSSRKSTKEPLSLYRQLSAAMPAPMYGRTGAERPNGSTPDALLVRSHLALRRTALAGYDPQVEPHLAIAAGQGQPPPALFGAHAHRERFARQLGELAEGQVEHELPGIVRGGLHPPRALREHARARDRPAIRIGDAPAQHQRLAIARGCV